ncbi:MAG: cation-translocating P-type ATPase, partial [Phycisphaerae bacterium]|nr:cation-translocating P-type ATPase [Phycisphaerae bacterium]
MAHDVLGLKEHDTHIHDHTAEGQTGRATVLIIGILAGGVLVLLSYLSDWIFSDMVNMQGRNWYSDTLALAGALLLGIPIIAHAARCLLCGHTHMDELVALAVIAAIAALDYKAAGVVAFFLLLANLIETRTALGARASIESLLQLAPKKAMRLTDDGEAEVDPRELSEGDVVRIRPGENIPADGVIV